MELALTSVNNNRVSNEIDLLARVSTADSD